MRLFWERHQTPMPAKTLLAILFVISIAVATLVVVRALPAKSEAEQAAAAPTREILVTASPLAAGTLLRAEDVRWWSPPSDAQFAGEIVRPTTDRRDAKPEAKPEADDETRAEVRGTALRAPLAAGAPVLRGNLVKPGDRDFLRIVLLSGARAVAVPIPVGSGLLYPGDHVDVILTQTFRSDGPAARRSVSETIAQDLRVLAVDSKSDGAARAVTLEVNSEQAERLNVATELGKLALTLRGGPARAGNTSPSAADGSRKPIWAGDVSGALGGAAPTAPAPVSPADRPAVHVLHGTKNAETLKQD